jgi:mycothiol synthase
MHVVQPFEVAGITVSQVDIRNLSDREIEETNEFENILRAESRPEDPPRPLELTQANLRNIPPSYEVYVLYGRDASGRLVAEASVGYFKAEENAHLLEGSISVLPEHRERGVAREMLRAIADIADAEGRTLLMSSTSERVPAGEAFAKAVGAEAGLRNHTNRLLLADVNREMVDRWVAEGPGRAPGYTLIAIDGPYPEEQIEAIADMHEVMNTAPRDDLDMEDYKLKPEHLREWEQSMTAAGDERWSLFVRHDETGQLVGFTEVIWNPKMPKVVGQMGTGVRPEHRGHALGKWLKAAMLQRVLRERANAEEIRTGNADSNDPMLGINTQLGFKPYISSTVWQVKVEQIRAYLGARV